MKQEEALNAIAREWKLQKASKEALSQAAFALKITNDLFYQFPCSGDRYQVIMGHLDRIDPQEA